MTDFFQALELSGPQVNEWPFASRLSVARLSLYMRDMVNLASRVLSVQTLILTIERNGLGKAKEKPRSSHR